MNSSKDLTKEAPRSPRERVEGFAILGRIIDKCRSTLDNQSGEYHFNCELDQVFFNFKGINAEDFKNFLSTGALDLEIGQWVLDNGISKTTEEIKAWSDNMDHFSYVNSNDPEDVEWFRGECARLGLDPVKTTLFDYLEVDDKASFPQK